MLPMLATVLVHALITAVDPGGHSLRIVHDPFPGMNMRMEMTTYEPNARDTRVKPGARVRLRCDTTTTPWVCRDVVREVPRAADRATSVGAQWNPAAAMGLPVKP